MIPNTEIQCQRISFFIFFSASESQVSHENFGILTVNENFGKRLEGGVDRNVFFDKLSCNYEKMKKLGDLHMLGQESAKTNLSSTWEIAGI